MQKNTTGTDNVKMALNSRSSASTVSAIIFMLLKCESLIHLILLMNKQLLIPISELYITLRFVGKMDPKDPIKVFI